MQNQSSIDPNLKIRSYQHMASERRHLQSVERYLRVINEFAVAISQMKTVGEIVWAITQHAISQLDFEECVVYLLDSERDSLMQSSAYGPKSPTGDSLINPIEILMGEGIVGSAAKSGRAVRVVDTRKDPRYIVDDMIRLSELAVPIVFEEKVLGVIDSEHSEVGFFTQRHLNILMTLASLAAPRIAFIQVTEEALSKSEDEVIRKNIELQQALSRLQETHAQLLGINGLTEEISRAKSVFVSSMSHELRTPLNSIIGYSEMLIEDLKETQNKDQMVADIGRIEAAGRQLLELIDKLPNISEIDKG